jgi:hypothetical protein
MSPPGTLRPRLAQPRLSPALEIVRSFQAADAPTRVLPLALAAAEEGTADDGERRNDDADADFDFGAAHGVTP